MTDLHDAIDANIEAAIAAETMSHEVAEQVIRDNNELRLWITRIARIEGLACDDDGYWSATVVADSGDRIGVSFPDWYPESMSGCIYGRMLF